SAADGRPWSEPAPVAALSWPRSGADVAVGQQPGQQRLLSVEAVLRLIPDHGGGTVDHRSGDLLTEVGGQTVQEDPTGQLHELVGYLVGSEGPLAAVVL